MTSRHKHLAALDQAGAELAAVRQALFVDDDSLAIPCVECSLSEAYARAMCRHNPALAGKLLHLLSRGFAAASSESWCRDQLGKE